MTFEKWWSLNGTHSLSFKAIARLAYVDATELERDACAAECDSIGNTYRQEVRLGRGDKRTLGNMALMMDICAKAIRDRVNKE